jgi:phosphoheptose isomerase
MTATFELRNPVLPAPVAPTKFPAAGYKLASSYSSAYFEQLARAASSIDLAQLDRAAAILVEAYTTGATVMACGNGGSAAIANHLQCDHQKGVRTETDLSPRVISLSTNVELLTAIANDIGYEDVFVYQLQSHASAGDVVIAISSSGRSANVVRALEWARNHELRTIALTGFEGGDARRIAEVAIHIDCTNYGIIEDLHQVVMHTLAQYVRQSRMSADMIALRTF